MVAEHRLNRVALIRAFGEPAEAYVRVGVPGHSPTGIGVLDDQMKSDDTPNFNNIAFVTISRKYLSDDLTVIRDYPGVYVRSVLQ